MGIVEITGGAGSVPIRIEVADDGFADAGDIYAAQETREAGKAVVRAAAKVVTKTAEQIYGEAVAMACEAAAQTAQRLAAVDAKDRPDEFEVEFGLSLGSGLDTRIVSLDAGAQVKVRMQWNRRAGD